MSNVFRHAYGTRVSVAARRSVGPGAVQSFKAECDINNIMKKYQKTGVVTWLAKRGGEYLEVDGQDFLEAMETVLKAQTMFDELPSSVRDRFQNDPAKFLDFMHQEGNLEEMVKLGLAKAPVVAPAPAPVPGKVA